MMKSILVSVAAVALLAACNEQRESKTINTAEDMVSAPVGELSAATLGSNTVAGYVPNALRGDMYEIQAADIALEKSTSDGVKQLARMIKTDHTAAENALKALAPTAAPDVTVPTDLDQRRQGLIDNLRAATAADFDKTWVDQQIAAHQEALTLNRGFSGNTDHPQLAEHARSVITPIENHLRAAEALRDAREPAR